MAKLWRKLKWLVFFLGHGVYPPSWNCDVESKLRRRQSMRIYVKKILATFHPDPFWKDGAWGFFEEIGPTRRSTTTTTTTTTRWTIWDQFL